MRVRQCVFVEMMEVGDAEVAGGEEGGGGRGEVGEGDVDRGEDGAEYDLFGERGGDVVAVALGGVEGLGDGGIEVVGVEGDVAFDEDFLEERAEVEGEEEEEGLEGREWRDRVPA